MQSIARRRWIQQHGRTAAAWALAGAGLLPAAGRAGPVEVIAKAKPSLVVVGSYRVLDNPRFTFRGTGFAVGDGRFVVTSGHVLPDIPPDAVGASIAVLAAGPTPQVNDMRRATVVSHVREHDLALLRIEGAPLPPLALADPQEVVEGRGVVLMGFPLGGVLGFTPVSHRGMVSAITAIAQPAANSRQLNEQALARLRRGPFEVYQLDATAYPGNSGGPVLDDETGRVIGVVNMVFIKGSKESALTDPSGISYALPVRLVNELLQSATR